ncbi:hypothetical protein LCGC14_1939210, partial [marine sediment metagenome]
AQRLRELLTPAASIVCIGGELSGDDAAGVAVAERLAGSIPWRLFNTQTAPESFLMKIVAGEPDLLILIDALDFGAEPGTVELLRAEGLTGQGPSTHGPAPMMFLEALRMMHPVDVWFLGVQPQHVRPGVAMSDPVTRAVELIVRAFQIASGAAPTGGS